MHGQTFLIFEQCIILNKHARSISRAKHAAYVHIDAPVDTLGCLLPLLLLLAVAAAAAAAAAAASAWLCGRALGRGGHLQSASASKMLNKRVAALPTSGHWMGEARYLVGWLQRMPMSFSGFIFCPRMAAESV